MSVSGVREAAWAGRNVARRMTRRDLGMGDIVGEGLSEKVGKRKGAQES